MDRPESPSSPTQSAPASLRGNIGRFQYLALGFGTIIGSAWVFLLGGWLTKAGPGGAIMGFLCGAIAMMCIGACYAELSGCMPEAGSEFIYAHRVYGRGVAFVVGWFLVLYLVSVTIFEGLALSWIIQTVFPVWKATTMYTAFGSAISTETIAISGIGALVIFALNYRGSSLAIVSHTVLTYGFVTVVLVVLAALLINGHMRNASPIFASMSGNPWWSGAASIFAFCAYGLYGFQTIPQTIEERSPRISLRTIALVIVASIAAGALFYCLVILATSVALPWQSLASAPLPVTVAASSLPHGQYFVVALLIATLASLFKAWNGIFMSAVRLLVAMARAGYIPHRFAELHGKYRAPTAAVCLIGILNMGGLFLGTGAVGPIADMCAMVLTLTYVMCCLTVLRLRKQGSSRAHRLLDVRLVWITAAAATVMVIASFVSPLLQRPVGLPLQWRLLIAWGLIGTAVWFAWVRRAPVR